MSTVSGVPGAKHWFMTCVTRNVSPAAVTRTVEGTKLHESTTVRRFTVANGSGCAGTIWDAAPAPVAPSSSAINRKQFFMSTIISIRLRGATPIMST